MQPDFGDAGEGLKLYAAMGHVSNVFPTVFYAPARWATKDGCIPHRALWAQFAVIDAIDARQQLNMILATALAYHGGEDRVQRVQDTASRLSPR